MRIFVTGATGLIGSVVTNELIRSGHEVVGLARTDESAAKLTKAGAGFIRGSLSDLDVLKKGAAPSDGVINLAFNHDFRQFEASAREELNAIEAMGETLKGTGRPLVIASGGPVLDESAPFAAGSDRPANPRMASSQAVLALAKQGVRASIVRLAPCVHDGTKRGFVGMLVDIARKTGISGYVGDGSNRWSAVHSLDAARLFRLACEKASAGSVWQGVGDEGISLKEIAEKIGQHLNVAVGPIARENVPQHFGWLGGLVGADIAASSKVTQERSGWRPTHPGLLYDIDHGHFFDNP